MGFVDKPTDNVVCNHFKSSNRLNTLRNKVKVR